MGGKDSDGISGEGRVQSPLVERFRVSPIQCRRVQESLDCGSGFPFPESGVLDATESGGRSEAFRTDHRRQRILTPPHRRPAHPRGQSRGELLRVEHGDLSLPRPRFQRCGEVVRAGGGRDDGTGCVENRVDDHMQAFSGTRWPDQQNAVFDRGPYLPAFAGTEEISDISRGRLPGQ